LIFGTSNSSFGASNSSFGASELSLDPIKLSFSASKLDCDPSKSSLGAIKLSFGVPNSSLGAPELSFGASKLSFGVFNSTFRVLNSIPGAFYLAAEACGSEPPTIGDGWISIDVGRTVSPTVHRADRETTPSRQSIHMPELGECSVHAKHDAVGEIGLPVGIGQVRSRLKPIDIASGRHRARSIFIFPAARAALVGLLARPTIAWCIIR
jgi:hypothetical protein